MNRRTVLTLLAAASLTATLATAADKPDFSGTWKLNVDKSDFGPVPAPDKLERKITHTDPKLAVSSTSVSAQGEQKSEATYSTDGKEAVNKLGGVDVKSVATWDGANLNIKYKREVQGMDINFLEVWTLAPDGKVLTIVNNLNTPQGDFALKMVMDKQ